MVVGGCGIFCAGCGIFGKGKEPADSTGEKPGSEITTAPGKDQTKLGRVAYVSPFGFVLIESRYANRISAGTEIRGRSEDGAETCTLRSSPEKKPSFIVADILTGAPEIGHWAYAPEKSLDSMTSGNLDIPGAGRVPLAPGSENQGPPDDLPPLPDFPASDPGDLPELELD